MVAAGQVLAASDPVVKGRRELFAPADRPTAQRKVAAGAGAWRRRAGRGSWSRRSHRPRRLGPQVAVGQGLSASFAPCPVCRQAVCCRFCPAGGRF